MKLDTPIHQLVKKLKLGELKSLDLVRESFNQIERLDSDIQSFVLLNEKAEEAADKVDQKLAQGEDVGILAGIPIAVKEMFCVKNMETTACSKILKGFVPPYSASVVNKVEAEGAIIIGKTNCDEFAMGSSNESSTNGIVRNPWDFKHVPGGSSGGSAACVASRMVSASFGTDTGGSIRQPASFTGVVGLKPTYGRVSRYGIVAFASSLDQAGPMTLNVRDAALMLEAMAGHDPLDSTCSKQPIEEWSNQIQEDVHGKVIGLPKEYFDDGLSDEVRGSLESLIGSLERGGAKFIEIDLPHTKYAVSSYYIICTSEASSNLARYDGVRFGKRSSSSTDLDALYMNTRSEGFGDEVKRRIMLGTFALSSGYYDAYYLKACRVRRLIQEDFIGAFKKCDAILGPVATTPAFQIGERIDDPVKMYLNDIYTLSANLAGLPGISVPVSVSDKGLPIGVQLIAPHFMEQTLFDIGKKIEVLTGWNQRCPDVV